MAEEDSALVSVRADTGAFARDVAAMKAELEGPLAQAGVKAARDIGGALSRAAQEGGTGFREFENVALKVIKEIAGAIIKMQGSAGGGAGPGAGIGGGLGTAGGGSGVFALLNVGLTLGRALLGLRQREGGGPVEAGRPFLVGERGPELFVPPGAGRIMRDDEGGFGGAARSIAITVNVKGGVGESRDRMALSGRQIARAVRDAVAGIED